MSSFKTVTVRGLVIGEGRPKVCVPIVGATQEEIFLQARALPAASADLAEWRADWYRDVSDLKQVLDTARQLRQLLGGLPLLFTFRSSREGGQRELSSRDYRQLCLAVAQSGLTDLMDVELFAGEDCYSGPCTLAAELIPALQETGVKVIASSHDFLRTPQREELLRRLLAMQRLGADILKLAVMPRCREDVLTLLSATLEMSSRLADRPIITMSMGPLGLISRLAGEAFGSALTFGSAGKASAPGQLGAADLSHILQVMHEMA